MTDGSLGKAQKQTITAGHDRDFNLCMQRRASGGCHSSSQSSRLLILRILQGDGPTLFNDDRIFLSGPCSMALTEAMRPIVTHIKDITEMLALYAQSVKVMTQGHHASAMGLKGRH
jgi:hypothetical protein